MKRQSRENEQAPTESVKTRRRSCAPRPAQARQNGIEKALRESEARYRDLVDSATDMMFTLSEDGVFTSLNPAFETITGWPKSECIGKQFLPIIHPDDTHLATEMHQRAFQSHRPLSYELRVLSKSGEYLLAEFKCTPQLYDGTTVGILAIARDITERKRAERALKISHRLLGIANRRIEMNLLLKESIVEIKYFTRCAAIGLRLLDDDDSPIYEFYEGLSKELFELEEVFSLYTNQSTNRTDAIENPTLPYRTEQGAFYINGTTRFIVRVPEGQEGQTCMMCNDLGYESIALVPIYIRGHAHGLLVVADSNEDALPLDMVETLEGVSLQLGMAIERVQSDQAMRESEAKYSALVEQATDGVVIIQDGICCFANAAMSAISGYEVTELLSMSFAEMVGLNLEELVFHKAKAPYTNGIAPPAVCEAKLGCKDATSRDVEISCGTVLFRGRVAVMGIARDITERKRGEEERERLNAEVAEKNQELEQVIYVTSHDLRSPLVNVEGFSKELGYSVQELASIIQSEEIPDNAREQANPILECDIPEALQHIQTSTVKMDSLLAGLLRLSRLGRAVLNLERLDMNQLLADIRSNFEYKIKETKVKVKIEKLPPCIGDADQINQVFSNLMGNALKYLDPATPGSIRITGQQEQERVVYCVEDNGVGIPEEYHAKVFEIFHRIDPVTTSGEGLGLSIVKRIVSRHNGEIWVDSKSGVGSKFFVALPKSQ